MSGEQPPRRLPPPVTLQPPQGVVRLPPPRRTNPFRRMFQTNSSSEENAQISVFGNSTSPPESRETRDGASKEHGPSSLHTTTTNALQVGIPRHDMYNPPQEPSINNVLQRMSLGDLRPSSSSPAPLNKDTRFLQPGTGESDRSARSRSKSPSAQRLPGVKDAPIIRKVLSLDGGGVRGLSTIIILKHIMKILKRKRGYDVRPWEEFDMIGGTSTGGLLAIMLGRLHMSLDECEQKYVEMSARIFTPARGRGNVVGRSYDFLQANGKFRPEPLEETIQEILSDSGLPADTLLMNEDPESCKVFVCATRAENATTVLFRSYETDNHDSLADSIKIWEAARATSAASTFFPPITIGSRGQKFVDGALKHNNPINLVDLESAEIWPQQDRIIISIGTGDAPGEDLLGNLTELARQIARIVTATEEENELFLRKHQAMIKAQRLYRFNVLQGLGNVGLDEYEAQGRIGAHTDHYLNQTNTKTDIMACSSTLAEGAQRLDYVGGEDLTAHFAKIALNDVMCAYCPHCLKGIPFNIPFYQCRQCMILVCERCHAHHDRTHNQYFARCKAVQWEPRMKGFESERLCDHCSQACRDRAECRACPANLCIACWSDNERLAPWQRKHYQEHMDHKEISLFLPKDLFMLKGYQGSCPCIDDPSFILHCDRCLNPIRYGESFYNCRECVIEYSSMQDLCETCLIDDLGRHTPGHAFRSQILELDRSARYDLNQSSSQMLRCSDSTCGIALLPENVKWHQHLQLQWKVGTLLAEELHSNAVRKCPRLKLRRTFPQSANPSKTPCFFCKKFIPFWNGALLSICLTSGCFQGFCDHCTTAKRQNHRHPLANVGFIKRNLVAGVGDFRKMKCDECNAQSYFSLFIGMTCAKCQDWDVCITCLKRGIMPKKHEACDGMDWLFFREQ